MEDLIASLSGTMHVSQEYADLETVKAHLARTLGMPAAGELEKSPGRSRAPSLVGHPALTFNVGAFNIHQPFPSPSQQYSALPYEDAPTPSDICSSVSSSSSSSFGSSYQDDMSLEQAFQGDAFAPQPQVSGDGAWAAFRGGEAPGAGAAACAWDAQPAALNPFATAAALHVPHGATAQFEHDAPAQYGCFYDDDEMMDQDGVEDMLDEERALNNGTFHPYSYYSTEVQLHR